MNINLLGVELSIQKRDEQRTLQRQLDRLEEDASYIKDIDCRRDVSEAVKKARDAIVGNNFQEAKSQFYEAQHRFTLVRYHNQVLFYRKGRGVWIAIGYLLLFIMITAIAIWYPPIQDKNDSLVFLSLLALAAGGIGGATAVLSRIVGMEVETHAITAQLTWYTTKPVLGAIMGLITYLAFFTGFSLLSNNANVDKPSGVFLISFLGGYWESFSTKILNQVANRLADSPERQTSSVQIISANVTNEAPRKGEKTMLNVSVTRGKPPYTYSITFTPSIIPAIKDINSPNGSIEQEVSIPSTGINTDTEVGFQIDVKDSAGNTTTYKDEAKKFIVKM